MLNTLIWIAVFIVSLSVLIKASDYFTSSAEKIGIFFGIPAFIIGSTIVAFGTSLPELVTSVVAVIKNSSEIVAGNVVGSNIANIFLVLGLVAIINKRITIHFNIIHIDLPFLIGSSFLLALSIWDGLFGRFDTLLFLSALTVFIWYTMTKREKKKEDPEEAVKNKGIIIKALIILAVSCLFIYLGAKYTIEAVIKLAEVFNVNKEIIAVSAVALGTSLPEVMVSLSAARKGNAEMAVGNILGSNIFNSFAVMGISALFGPLVIPASILTFALPVMVIATILFYVICHDNKVSLWEGWMLIIFYVFFIGKLFSPL